MAKYIIQKLPEGMHGEGERLFPRLVDGQVIDMKGMAEKIENASSFKCGDVIGVLTEFVYQVKTAMADGNSVRIDGLGTLRPVLGLVEEGRRGEWKDAAGRITAGRNVRLKTINFRPDKRLRSDVGLDMELVKVDDSAVKEAGRGEMTSEERVDAARRYLAENGYMRVADYVSLTHLAYSTAARELRCLAADGTSGISSQGTGSGRIYVARK